VTKFSYEQFDLSDVTTYSLASRHSKSQSADFARPVAPGSTIGSFVDSLPNILAAADFKKVVRTLVDVKQSDGGILWGLGAHVVKTGVGPALIQLL
jgi:hypothetical protein